MFQRLAISSCRSRIDTDASWKILSSVLWKRTQSPAYNRCIVHTRLVHTFAVRLQKHKLKENEILENVSTLQIKKRSSRRNVLSDDNAIPKPNVSSF